MSFGNPHRNYKNKKQVVDTIFEKFDDETYDCHLIRDLKSQFKVPERTLYHWQEKHENDKDWRPYSKRKRSDKTFTDEEEKAISDFVEKNIILPHRHFQDDDFRKLVFSTSNEEGIDLKDFRCGHSFVTNFKKRNRFSSRKAHFKKRPAKQLTTIEEFKQQIRDKMASSNYQEIWVNCDETQWTVLPKHISTWAKTNSQDNYILTSDNEKDAITALCSIQGGPDFKKLPLFLVGKDDTEHHIKTIFPKDISPHKSVYSKSVWMNEILFQKYLRFLRKQFPNNAKINLLLDQSSTHKGDDITALANRLNIELHYLPAGSTDSLQPLDIRVNGVLKAIGDKKKAQLLDALEDQPIGITNSIAILIDIWDNIISTDTIQESWSLYTQ